MLNREIEIASEEAPASQADLSGAPRDRGGDR